MEIEAVRVRQLCMCSATKIYVKHVKFAFVIFKKGDVDANRVDTRRGFAFLHVKNDFGRQYCLYLSVYSISQCKSIIACDFLQVRVVSVGCPPSLKFFFILKLKK